MRLDAAPQAYRLMQALVGESGIAVPARDAGEAIEHVVAKESQPDAFALAFRAHLVHAIVPVARADQRQPMLANAGAALDGTHAVLVQARRFAGARGHV